VLDVCLDGINLRREGIEVSELGWQIGLACCSRGAVRGHATAVCAYVVVVRAAAGHCDVLEDGVAACVSILHPGCGCASFTHLLWRLQLSSVPRMPSSRRRVVWLICAVGGAAFKECQPALAASMGTGFAHLCARAGHPLAETARREQRQSWHLNIKEILQR